MNNKWEKTSKALKELLKILSCAKCKESLHSSQQFLNCGHILCFSCIDSSNKACLQCQVFCENDSVLKDDAIGKIIQACCDIAKVVGLSHNVETKSKATGFEQNETKPSISKKLPRRMIQSKLPFTAIKKRKVENNANGNKEVKRLKYKNSVSNLRIPKNINKKNHVGETKLHEACRKGHEQFVQILLNAGADINIACNAGWTPLQESVDYGYYNITKILLDAGAEVNKEGHKQKTALHQAAENNNIDMVKLLLQYDANKNVKDEEEKKPVDYCTSIELKNLLCCGDQNIKTENNDIEIVFAKIVSDSSRDNQSNEMVKNECCLNELNFDTKCSINNPYDRPLQESMEIADTKDYLNNMTHDIISSQESIDVVNTCDIDLKVDYSSQSLLIVNKTENHGSMDNVAISQCNSITDSEEIIDVIS